MSSLVLTLSKIPYFTFQRFKIHTTYKLSDFSYGEWIIYEEDIPKYYFNLFNEFNSCELDYLLNEKLDVKLFIELIFDELMIENLFWEISRSERNKGIYLWFKETSEKVTIETFPLKNYWNRIPEITRQEIIKKSVLNQIMQ